MFVCVSPATLNAMTCLQGPSVSSVSEWFVDFQHNVDALRITSFYAENANLIPVPRVGILLFITH